MIIGGCLGDNVVPEHASERNPQLPTGMVLVIVQRVVTLCKRTSESMLVRPIAAPALDGQAGGAKTRGDASGTRCQLDPRAALLLVLVPITARRAAASRRGLALTATGSNAVSLQVLTGRVTWHADGPPTRRVPRSHRMQALRRVECEEVAPIGAHSLDTCYHPSFYTFHHAMH